MRELVNTCLHTFPPFASLGLRRSARFQAVLLPPHSRVTEGH